MQSLSIMNPRWDPIKNEIELARWIGDEIEVQDGYKFAFQIRLKDARLSEPVEVIAAMERFAAKAKVVIESLETRCREVLA